MAVDDARRKGDFDSQPNFELVHDTGKGNYKSVEREKLEEIERLMPEGMGMAPRSLHTAEVEID